MQYLHDLALQGSQGFKRSRQLHMPRWQSCRGQLLLPRHHHLQCWCLLPSWACLLPCWLSLRRLLTAPTAAGRKLSSAPLGLVPRRKLAGAAATQQTSRPVEELCCYRVAAHATSYHRSICCQRLVLQARPRSICCWINSVYTYIRSCCAPHPFSCCFAQQQPLQHARTTGALSRGLPNQDNSHNCLLAWLCQAHSSQGQAKTPLNAAHGYSGLPAPD
jgi:hypothetical protein